MAYEEDELPLVEPDQEMNALTGAVIGAAIEVHRQLGPGLDEVLYAAALCIEVRLRGIEYKREVPVNVEYKGESIGTKRLDFVVGGRLVVELKAVEELNKLHKAQVRTYLKITGYQLGLLINFNTLVLKEGIKRVIRN